MLRFRSFHWGALLAMVVISASHSVLGSEQFSESVFVPPAISSYLGNPVSGWNGFGILMAGNPVLPTQSNTDTNTDPFAENGTSTVTTESYNPLGTDAGIFVGPGPVTTPGLERLHFTGTVPITQGNIPAQNLDNPTDQVQFGVVGPVDNSAMNFVSQHWIGSYIGAGDAHYNYLRSVPIVSIIPSYVTPASASNLNYLVDFVQFTQDGISGSEWAEFPYPAGSTAPTFSYGGWADPVDSIHFTYAAIQLSPTQIPLDDLNFADDPLGGNVTLDLPSFSITNTPADVVPEPVGATLAALGFLGLCGRRKRPLGTAIYRMQ